MYQLSFPLHINHLVLTYPAPRQRWNIQSRFAPPSKVVCPIHRPETSLLFQALWALRTWHSTLSAMRRWRNTIAPSAMFSRPNCRPKLKTTSRQSISPACSSTTVTSAERLSRGRMPSISTSPQFIQRKHVFWVWIRWFDFSHTLHINNNITEDNQTRKLGFLICGSKIWHLLEEVCIVHCSMFLIHLFDWNTHTASPFSYMSQWKAANVDLNKCIRFEHQGLRLLGDLFPRSLPHAILVERHSLGRMLVPCTVQHLNIHHKQMFNFIIFGSYL